MVFFFQAEDGIRDVAVTGVQTCALPIYFDIGRPYIDEYHILSTPDSATRLAAFRSGQSDVNVVQSLSEVEAVRKTNPATVVQEIRNVQTFFGLALAQDKPPFNDVRVRRAVSTADQRPQQVC